jgi:methanogenic corrinoid protein MtbC1
VRRLDLPTGNGHGDSLSTLAERLHEALLRGDGETVRAIVHGCHQRGQPLEAVADQVVAPALTWIGRDWQYGRIDVYQEHRATRLCEGVLFDLKADLEAGAPSGRPVAVGGAPEHDPTVIPSLLIQIVLLDNGWQAVNLGPHTPVAAFRRAVHDLEPKLLWLSFTHPLAEDDSFLRAYHDLYEDATERGVAVAVGGQGLRPELRAVMPYTAFGDGISQLGSLARSLHPPRRRPRRGRPAR